MLSLSRLPWMNLRGYPVRTGTLVFFSMLMTMTIFGGTLVVQGIEHGLRTTQSRLGADIMVTPDEADTDFDAQTFLVNAEPSYFYMDASTREAVAAVDGVEAASSQLFLASARASCCSGRYQVIAYDPATDFTIQPWMNDAVGQTQLGENEVIVGANVLANDPENFQLFDNTLRVVGQFDPTGSTLDNAVYMNFETAKKVIDSSLRKGLNKYSTLETDRIISSVMVKVAPGYDAEAVAAQIREQVPGVSVATSTKLVSGIAQSLEATSRTVTTLIAVAWGVGLLMITLMFVLIDRRAQERIRHPHRRRSAPSAGLAHHHPRGACGQRARRRRRHRRLRCPPHVLLRPRTPKPGRGIPRPVAAHSGAARTGSARVGGPRRPRVLVDSATVRDDNGRQPGPQGRGMT